MFMLRKNLIKIIAVLSCSAIAHGMQNTGPECRETDNGFQVFDPTTNTWGAEIHGYWPCYNCDNSAALMCSGDALFTLVKTSNGHTLTNPSRARDCSFDFSPKGKFACFADGTNHQTTIVNIEREQSFIVPGVNVTFSFDESFVIACHAIHDELRYTIFKTANGEQIKSIPGRYILLNPCSSIIAVGEDYGSNVSLPNFLADPILIDLTTGHQIGKRIKGAGRNFTPDGKFLIVQQSREGSHLPNNPVIAFYAAANGVVKGRIPGWAESAFETTALTDWEREFSRGGRHYKNTL